MSSQLANSLPTACQQLAVLAASEVIDSTCLDLLLPVRSMACSELALLVLDFLRLGSSLLPHSRDAQHFEPLRAAIASVARVARSMLGYG